MKVHYAQTLADDAGDRSPGQALNQAPLLSTELTKIHWFSFFKKGKSGCIFASMVEENPDAFGWVAKNVGISLKEIQHAIYEAIVNPTVNTLSLIFPTVRTKEKLLGLLELLTDLPNISIEFSNV